MAEYFRIDAKRCERYARRRAAVPAATVLLVAAAVAAAWVWGSSPEGRRAGTLVSAPRSANAGAPAAASIPSDVQQLQKSSAATPQLPGPPVRAAAVARMAARLHKARLFVGAQNLTSERSSGKDAAAAAALTGSALGSLPVTPMVLVTGTAAAAPSAEPGVLRSAVNSQQNPPVEQHSAGSGAVQQQAAIAAMPEPKPSTSDSTSNGTRDATAATPGAGTSHTAVPVPPSQELSSTSHLPTPDSSDKCQPSLLVVLTSHKTGTAQAACITEAVERKHIMQGAARHDDHPQNLHAVSEFARQRLQTHFSGGGSGRLYCPSVKFYSTGHHLPRLEDESCPGTLPCPCDADGNEQCLSTDGGSIDIPSGNTTVVQVIRNPVDAVLSAYQYHTQAPAPEEWLENMSMQNFTGWMLAGGVPREVLASLGAFEALPEDSYYSFLRRLPREEGVQLQFWMSAWELYGFARQYTSLARQQQHGGFRFMPLRFEDLQKRYNTTARTMLDALKEHVPQLDVDQMFWEVQGCHPSSWTQEHLASHDHITASRDPGLRRALRPVLMSHAEIAPRLCQLSEIFGYSGSNGLPECAGSSSGRGGSSDGSVGSSSGSIDSSGDKSDVGEGGSSSRVDGGSTDSGSIGGDGLGGTSGDNAITTSDAGTDRPTGFE